MGGFVACLPESVRRHYEEVPVLDVLLRLSEDLDTDVDYVNATRGQVLPFLEGRGIEYVVVNTRTAVPVLLTFIASIASLPLTLALSDGDWRLYTVDPEQS